MAVVDSFAKQCEPCRGGLPPLSRQEALWLLADLRDWQLLEEPVRIEKSYRFADFAAAQSFAVAVGGLAEAEGHHPDIRYGWGYCAVAFRTHEIDGLHRNDFIMAAQVDRLSPPKAP